jgi:hypothetical protein
MAAICAEPTSTRCLVWRESPHCGQPEFQELDVALVAYLSEGTERVIREEVHRETGEAEEIDEPPQIGR